MMRSYDTQDFVSAIEDGVLLIQKFPGGKRAQESADRVLEIYLSLSIAQKKNSAMCAKVP